MRIVNKYFLTKDDSKILYGIAILFMIAHHLWGFPDRFDNRYISLLPIGDVSLEYYIGIFGKICVAIYAFISGYGLYISVQVIKHKNLKNMYKFILKHLWNFYKRYWFVFIVFVPIGFYWEINTFTLKEFTLAFIGRKANIYNGEWWYVTEYIKMLLYFPIYIWILTKLEIVRYYSGKNPYKIVIYILALVSFIMTRHYLFIFLTGIVFARYRVFEYIEQYLYSKRYFNNIFLILGTLGVFIFRSVLMSARFDDIIVIMFIYSAITLIRKIRSKNIEKSLCFLGRYSIYMWLVHTYWAYYYFQDIVLLPQYTVLIYIWLTILSLLTAMVLDRIYNIINNIKK